MDSTDELNKELDRILKLLTNMLKQIEDINNTLNVALTELQKEAHRWASQN